MIEYSHILVAVLHGRYSNYYVPSIVAKWKHTMGVLINWMTRVLWKA